MHINFVYEDGWTGSFRRQFDTDGIVGFQVSEQDTMEVVMADLLQLRVYSLWKDGDFHLRICGVRPGGHCFLEPTDKVSSIFGVAKAMGGEMIILHPADL